MKTFFKVSIAFFTMVFSIVGSFLLVMLELIGHEDNFIDHGDEQAKSEGYESEWDKNTQFLLYYSEFRDFQ